MTNRPRRAHLPAGADVEIARLLTIAKQGYAQFAETAVDPDEVNRAKVLEAECAYYIRILTPGNTLRKAAESLLNPLTPTTVIL